GQEKVVRASSDMIEWHELSPPGEPFGISCDGNGQSIGPVRLLKRIGDRFAPRPVNELEFIFKTAFEEPVDISVKVGGLRAAAQALNDGDLPRAMIATLLTRFPTLP